MRPHVWAPGRKEGGRALKNKLLLELRLNFSKVYVYKLTTSPCKMPPLRPDTTGNSFTPFSLHRHAPPQYAVRRFPTSSVHVNYSHWYSVFRLSAVISENQIVEGPVWMWTGRLRNWHILSGPNTAGNVSWITYYNFVSNGPAHRLIIFWKKKTALFHSIFKRNKRCIIRTFIVKIS